MTTSARLGHVHWIGGGSGGGKSTIARRLADQYGLRLYHTDRSMRDHAARSNPHDHPMLAEFMAMDMDERWVDRPVETMLETFHWFRGEAFEFIVDDLLSMGDTPVIVEGIRLLPAVVAPLLASPNRAVWLLPTPRFRRDAFTSRGGLWTIAGRTRDPYRALENLFERDDLFTGRLRREVDSLGLTGIDVDHPLAEADLARRVAVHFGLEP